MKNPEKEKSRRILFNNPFQDKTKTRRHLYFNMLWSHPISSIHHILCNDRTVHARPPSPVFLHLLHTYSRYDYGTDKKSHSKTHTKAPIQSYKPTRLRHHFAELCYEEKLRMGCIFGVSMHCFHQWGLIINHALSVLFLHLLSFYFFLIPSYRL